MDMRQVGFCVVLSVCALFVLPACDTLYVGAGGGYSSHPGPPPHAPAHGYRAKHHEHGPDLVFDSGLGVYVVAGLTDVYFHDAHYYRWINSGWEISVDISGPWKAPSYSKLPRGLQKKHGPPAGVPGAQGKGKGKGKKKGRYR